MKIFWNSDRIELFLSPVLNPGSPLIYTSHTKSLSKAILKKTGFFILGFAKNFFSNFNWTLRILPQQHKTKHTWGSVANLALPHLRTGFSIQVLFPWMPEGKKSFFIFYYLRNMGRTKGTCDQTLNWCNTNVAVIKDKKVERLQQRKLSTKKHVPGLISRARHQRTGK